MAVVRDTSVSSYSKEFLRTSVPVIESVELQSKTSTSHKVVKNVKSILLNFSKRVDITAYEELVYEVKNTEFSDEVLQQLLCEVRDVISLTDQNFHHFIESLLDLQWFSYGNEAVQEYQSFLIDLLAAHNYYVNCSIKRLVSSFKTVSEESDLSDGVVSLEEESWFEKIHDVLRVLLNIIPMSSMILHQALSKLFPYLRRSTHEHEVYVYNLLKITKYRPELRLEILLLIVNRVVCLDVHAPRTEIEEFEFQNGGENDGEPEVFTMDESVQERKRSSMAHPIANTLDAVMVQLFKYIHAVCYRENNSHLDWDATKCLYQDLLHVFERIILPTYNLHHVQFIMFYLCSFKVTIAEAFLNFLWRMVSSPNEAPTVRQAAVMYVSSLLARGTFVPVSVLKDMMAKIASWIHNYISNQDGLDGGNLDIRVHSVFFSTCQALFYLIAFRHGDLVNTKKDLTFLQSLNLTKMVTCRLNPLKVCIPPVVKNFASVTRTYQLAYCYTVIEHNSRNIIPVVYRDVTGVSSVLSSNEFLETSFPFDPFLLKRSIHAIAPVYREYQGSQSPAMESALVKKTMCTEEEEDDFLMDQSPSTSSLNPDLFSYYSSPGFKHM